jgi:hypothetical protein
MRRLADRERLPRSGNTALAAGALMQAALGLEYLLAGVNKVLDPDFALQFDRFVEASPGARAGILSPLVQGLILPHSTVAATVVTLTESGAGLVLLLSAVEVARRRLSGRLGRQHDYEPAVALLGAIAAVAVASLSATIYLTLGGGLPTVSGASAFGSPIAIDLFLVPLALSVGWLEIGRFLALRTGSARLSS